MEDNRGDILMYQTVDGKTAIEVMLSNDTVWLTIDKMAELFQRNKSTISRHPLYLQPIITQYFIDNKSEIWLLFLIAHSKR